LRNLSPKREHAPKKDGVLEEFLSSAGFGARLSLGHQFTLGAELAHAIDAPAAGDDGDLRLVYTLVGRR
jgi:hypothetical protein